MTDEAKILALQNLLASEGWNLIKEDLQNDIEITESKLHGETPLSEKESYEQLQRERIDRIELINLPENLIKELSVQDEPEDNFEAYD